MKDEDAKYYDPATNPLIRVPDVSEDTALGDGRAPFLAPSVTPETVRTALDQAFGGKLEAELAGRRLVKMADGSWTVDGVALKDAPPSLLADLSQALTADIG